MLRKITLTAVCAAMLFSTVPARADGPITLGLGTLTSIALSPGGTRLAVGTTIGVYFYDAQTFVPQGGWETGYEVVQIRWSPTGSRVALVSEEYWSNRLEVRDADGGKVLWSLTASEWDERFGQVAFDLGGMRLVATRDEHMEIYDAASGVLLQTFGTEEDSYSSYNLLAFSPNWELLATCCAYYNLLQVWDTATWQVKSSWRWQHNRAFDTDPGQIAWTTNGRYLATIGLDSVVLIWDVATRQIINQTVPAENIPSLAFSPDGKYLATGYEGGLARLWSGKDWQTHVPLRGHTGDVSHLVWSPDGHTLYSGGGNTVRAWDAATG